MNFADALRQVQGPTPGTGEAVPGTNNQDQASAQSAFVPDPSIEISTLNDHGLAAGSGNVVRLELFLDPSQMNAMLKALINSHQYVMTLREAASYLRISSQKLERMAGDHEVPGFLIDGRWRFPKVALDEWLSVQSTPAGEDQNNAA
ncbi:MAG: hypothetical protein HONBIEJF_01234 [Fimbriimonadaceae bacterium]|nr:hypothetical protein [Fimbriimonadaceae bacterium]